MDQATFESYMTRARITGGEYAAGYQRGLRRHFHGERFGTEEEHRLWMDQVTRPGREERGQGYRDGFEGKAPRMGDP